MKREMDQIGLFLCDIQGKIFQQSIGDEKCSSSIFIRRYMNSSFVSIMDSLAFFNERMTIEDIYEEINKEYGKTDYGKIKFSAEEMYWIGYIYRYLSYVYQLDSKNSFKIIKGSELRNLYFSYHTLDKDTNQMIKEGVNILRKIKHDRINKHKMI